MLAESVEPEKESLEKAIGSIRCDYEPLMNRMDSESEKTVITTANEYPNDLIGLHLKSS